MHVANWIINRMNWTASFFFFPDLRLIFTLIVLFVQKNHYIYLINWIIYSAIDNYVRKVRYNMQWTEKKNYEKKQKHKPKFKN